MTETQQLIEVLEKIVWAINHLGTTIAIGTVGIVIAICISMSVWTIIYTKKNKYN